MSTKVHRVVLLVLDDDDLGAGGITEVIEGARYPNRCISPSVMEIDTAEVEWDDDHPLNKSDTQREEFNRMFSPMSRLLRDRRGRGVK